MPRESDHDKVTMCDTLILNEVVKKRLCDTSQFMMFQMQQSVNSTTTGLPLPHLVRKILAHFYIEAAADPDHEFTQRFEAAHLHNLREHANMSYVPPAPPQLCLPAPPAQKGKGVKVEGASTSQEQGPLLRSKVDLVLLEKMDDLSSSVKEVMSSVTAVKNELEELKNLFGEKLTELIACLQSRVPAESLRDPPPQN